MFKWKLRACRVQAGYTQAEAAKLLGVTETTLIAWEAGKRAMKMEDAVRMAELYGIPLDLIDFTKRGNTTIRS